MQTIVKVLFGSQLYGTATPESDTDYKQVHIPAARDILLTRVKPIIQYTTKRDRREKNGENDIDVESFSLLSYVNEPPRKRGGFRPTRTGCQCHVDAYGAKSR